MDLALAHLTPHDLCLTSIHSKTLHFHLLLPFPLFFPVTIPPFLQSEQDHPHRTVPSKFSRLDDE